ncbi:pleckstrin homology domain-containing family F member 1 [Amia ocellicauda]|uniref:pleckstrin homology domain-containing family F member 1 n=1 Tax=Amia ocellicauda TaxID=2972642 RepID=UPI0034639A39|nr:PKHF1 protein [Amia calva]
MVERLAFTEENVTRIAAVESLFGPSGKPLAKPGRVLVGEGRLMKLCRRSPQPKMFFLFNDILVYGSIILHGHWYKNQHIIPLEDIVVEELEDSLDMKNQWLIRTPKKSFYVSAASLREKQAWIEHIEDCRTKQLLRSGRMPNTSFAATWIPDRASAICMRCSEKFTVTQRRHHCRQCGFVVCNACSKYRFVIRSISCKPVRVCFMCFQSLQAQKALQDRDEKNWSDEDELAVPMYEASSEEDIDVRDEDLIPSQWAKPQILIQKTSWSSYLR